MSASVIAKQRKQIKAMRRQMALMRDEIIGMRAQAKEDAKFHDLAGQAERNAKAETELWKRLAQSGWIGEALTALEKLGGAK